MSSGSQIHGRKRPSVRRGNACCSTVIRAATFEEMHRWSDRFDPGRIVPWGKAHSMLRKGSAGEAAELLSPELRQLIDDYSRTELRRLKCDFPYDLAYVKGQSILPICGGH